MLLCISITALVRSSKDHFCRDSERNEIWWKFYQIWAFHALLIIYVIVGQKKNPCRTWPGNIILKTREMCDGNAYTCQVLISILYKTTIMRPIASMRSGSWTRQVISVMQSSLMTTSIETNKAYTWLCCLWTYLGLPECCSLCYLKNHRLLPDHGWPDPLYVKLPWFGPLVHMHTLSIVWHPDYIHLLCEVILYSYCGCATNHVYMVPVYTSDCGLLIGQSLHTNWIQVQDCLATNHVQVKTLTRHCF